MSCAHLVHTTTCYRYFSGAASEGQLSAGAGYTPLAI